MPINLATSSFQQAIATSLLQVCYKLCVFACVLEPYNHCAGGVGLVISEKKTKLQKFCIANDGVLLRGSSLEVVDAFTYLGSRIDSSGDSRKEVDIRIGKASAAFGRLEKIWHSDLLSLKTTKMRVYNLNVLPELLYASETCEMRVVTKRTLNAFDIMLLAEDSWYLLGRKSYKELQTLRFVEQRLTNHRWLILFRKGVSGGLAM